MFVVCADERNAQSVNSRGAGSWCINSNDDFTDYFHHLRFVLTIFGAICICIYVYVLKIVFFVLIRLFFYFHDCVISPAAKNTDIYSLFTGSQNGIIDHLSAL